MFGKVFNTPLSPEDAKQDIVQWPNAFGKIRDGVIVKLPEPLIEEIDVAYAKAFGKEELAGQGPSGLKLRPAAPFLNPRADWQARGSSGLKVRCAAPLRI